MKIWLIESGEPLPLEKNVRLLRAGILAEMLAQRGHAVRWWTSAFDHQRRKMLADTDREMAVQDGLVLNLLHGRGYKNNISISRYVDHRILASKFRKWARKLDKPDIVIIGMPCHHLAYEAVRYAREMRIPSVVDVRDLWPDIFLDRVGNKYMRGIGRLMLHRDFSKLKSLLSQADSIVAVSGGYLNWALKKIGRGRGREDRIFYLGYRKDGEMDRNCGVPQWLQKYIGKKIVVYVGTFGVSYEIDLLLKVARRFEAEKRDDVCFVLAGTGEKEGAFRGIAESLSNVIMPGWITAPDIRALLRAGYVGIVPCKSANDTVPNKPFEYISSGLPLISSLKGEMESLINAHRMGLNYDVGDESGLYNCIAKTVDDEPMRNEMSANAVKFFDRYGDAGNIYAAYAEHIEKLVSAHGDIKNGKEIV